MKFIDFTDANTTNSAPSSITDASVVNYQDQSRAQ